MMSRYNMRENIPACHVNKALLAKLEDYIKNRIPNQIGISKKILAEKYSIIISDVKGSEEKKSISNYASKLFPDSIKDIKIRVVVYVEKYFELTINFNKEQLGNFTNNIEISYESNKAREVVSGINEGIKRTIEEFRNHNEFYHFSPYAQFFTLATSALFIYLSLLTLKDNHYTFCAISFSIGVLIFLYFIIGEIFKPFISFETNHYFRLIKSYTTFKLIVITIIVTIVATMIYNQLFK